MTGILTTLRRRWSRPARGRGLILLYHRVAELAQDPQLMAVSPDRFREHLEVIRALGTPLSLPEMVRAAARGTLPERAVAITFDDGYSDNLHHARPLLRSFDVPATVFVTAGQVGSDREFWWDELERLLLVPDRLPEVVQWRMGGRAHEWRLAEHESANPDADTWNVLCDRPRRGRHRLYLELCGLLRPAPAGERESVLAELREQTGMAATGRTTHRAMTADELCALAEGDLVEIGAHTVTHPELSSLSEVEQAREIGESKRLLERVVNRPVTSFSYPFGTRYDYSAATVKLVRDAGFTQACANEPGSVAKEADRLQLPRVLVRDIDGGALEHLLAEYFEIPAGLTAWV